MKTWRVMLLRGGGIPVSFSISFICCFGCRVTTTTKSFVKLLYAHTLGSISVFVGTDNLCGALENTPGTKPNFPEGYEHSWFSQIQREKIILPLSHLHNEMRQIYRVPRMSLRKHAHCVLIWFGDSQRGCKQFASNIDSSNWQWVFGGWRATRMWALALNLGILHSWESKYSMDLFIFFSLGLGIGAWICVWLQPTTCFLQRDTRRSHKDNTLILLASDSHLLVLFSLEEMRRALSRAAFHLDPSYDSTQPFSTLSKHTVVTSNVGDSKVQSNPEPWLPLPSSGNVYTVTLVLIAPVVSCRKTESLNIGGNSVHV